MTDLHPAAEVTDAGRAGSLSPVFVVGCGRSGTTLLRKMIDAHPEIAIPRESHFIYKIARQQALGRWPGDLSAPGAWDHLVDYLTRTPDLDRWDLDRGRLRDRLGALRERTHATAFQAVFEANLDESAGQRWGDKTPQHVQYMLVLDRLYPGAQFVHIIRDGRDVALSLLRKEGWGPRRMGEAGYYWAWLVLSGIVAGGALGPDRYYQLHYEDLVADPEPTLGALTRWLGHDYSDEMLTYYASAGGRRPTEARPRRPAGGAHPTSRPPDPAHIQKWRREMEAGDLRSISRQAGGLLAWLGYEVGDLSGAQEALRRRLDALVEPGALSALARSVRPVGGPEAVRTARLLGVRAAQLAALVGRRPEAFARSSFQWQVTVAELLT